MPLPIRLLGTAFAALGLIACFWLILSVQDGTLDQTMMNLDLRLPVPPQTQAPTPRLRKSMLYSGCQGFAASTFQLQPTIHPGTFVSTCWQYEPPIFMRPVEPAQSCHDSVPGPCFNLQQVQDHAAVRCNGMQCAMTMVLHTFRPKPALRLPPTTKYHVTRMNAHLRQPNEYCDPGFQCAEGQLSFGDLMFTNTTSVQELQQLLPVATHWPGTTFIVYYHYPFAFNPFHLQQGFWRAYYLLVGHCVRPDRIARLYANNSFSMGEGMWTFLEHEYQYFCQLPFPPTVDFEPLQDQPHLFASVMLADYEDGTMPWPYWVHSPILRFGADRLREFVGIPPAVSVHNASARIVLLLDRHGTRQIMNAPAVLHAIRTIVGQNWTIQHVFFADIPFEQQLKLVATASIIIGVHGAHFGMLNVINPGTLVVEIMPFLWRESVYEKVTELFGGVYVRSSCPTPQSIAPLPGETQAQLLAKMENIQRQYLPHGVSIMNLTSWHAPVLERLILQDYVDLSQWIIVRTAVNVNITAFTSDVTRALEVWQ